MDRSAGRKWRLRCRWSGSHGDQRDRHEQKNQHGAKHFHEEKNLHGKKHRREEKDQNEGKIGHHPTLQTEMSLTWPVSWCQWIWWWLGLSCFPHTPFLSSFLPV